MLFLHLKGVGNFPTIIIYYVGALFAGVAMATDSTAEDWLDPKLSSKLAPLSYVLWMHPEFYGSSAAVFHGRVDIDIEVLRSTRTIIVHYKTLNITSTTLTDEFGASIPVSSSLVSRKSTSNRTTK